MKEEYPAVCVEPDRGKSQHHDIGSLGSECGLHALIFKGSVKHSGGHPPCRERVSVPCQYTA